MRFPIWDMRLPFRYWSDNSQAQVRERRSGVARAALAHLTMLGARRSRKRIARTADRRPQSEPGLSVPRHGDRGTGCEAELGAPTRSGARSDRTGCDTDPGALTLLVHVRVESFLLRSI